MQISDPTEPPIRVLVIAPQPLVRFALAALVDGHDDLDLVRAIADARALPRRISADVLLGHFADEHRPEVSLPLVTVTLDDAPPRIVTAIRRAAGTDRAPQPRTTQVLSRRELEVVALVASGFTDHQIADALFLSVRTVRSHLDRIRTKTGLRRRADLTRWYVSEPRSSSS